MCSKIGKNRNWTPCVNTASLVSLFFSCFLCAEEENCVDEIMTGNDEWPQLIII